MLTKIILTVIVLAGAGLTRLVFNAVVIRRFGPELLGNINLSISTAFLFSLFVTAGLCPAAAKYIAQYAGRNDEKNSKRSFTIILFFVLILSMIISLLMFVNSKRLAQFMNGKQIWFAKASLVVFLYSLYLFCKRAYYGIDKVATYFKNEIFADAVFFLTLVILVLFNLVSLLIMPFILFYSVFLLWALYAQRSWISLSLCTKISKIRKNLKEIMSFSCISLVGTLSSMGGRHISTMLTGTYTSAKEVGYYSTSLSVSMALYLVANAVSMVLFPLMSRYYGRKDYASITSTLGNFSRWLLIVSSFLCGIALIFSRFIFNFVTGTDYRIGVFALQILIVGAYIGISGAPSISTFQVQSMYIFPTRLPF